MITSAANARYRALLKLGESAKERRRAGRTLLDGTHLVSAFGQACGPPELFVVSPDTRRAPEVAALLQDFPSVEVLELGTGLFGRLSSVESPTGILALIPLPAQRELPAAPGPCVVLEQVQDPGNLGSILRSTAAAGISEVYLSRGCADAWSPRVLRAGMGAHFLLKVFEAVDLGAFAKQYPGRLVATHHRARHSLFATDLRGTTGLVFGNEGAGLTRELLDAASTVVAIPMPGQTESLNIAAAAAVCLFERVRQVAGTSGPEGHAGPQVR
jgi:RNA methyltransferase, TrmH family